MTLPDTLLINGTDLASFRLVVADLSGLHAPGTRRGDNVVIPGRAGEIRTDKVYAAYVFDVPVTLLEAASDGSIASTQHERRAQFLANLKDVQELCDAGALTLTRRLAVTGGGYAEMTCAGEYVAGLAVTLLNAETGNTVLQFKNLDGCWTDGTGGKHL